MEEICRNCQHFEPKGVMIDKNTYGLCPRFVNGGKPGVFRWGDAGCVDFKPKEKSKQARKIIPPIKR